MSNNDDTTSSGPLKPNGRRLTVVSSPKKTDSENLREPAINLSPTGPPSKKSQVSVSASSSTNKIRVPKPQVKRAAEALARFKVKPEQLETVPQFSSIFRAADGGLKAVLEAMRFSGGDEVIGAFLKVYDKIPAGDRERIPWEAIAIKAKIDTPRLIGSIMIAMQTMSQNTVRVIAWSAHPAVMKKTVQFAKMASGEKDRQLFHTGTGWLPTAKGPTFIGKAVFDSNGHEKHDEPEVFSADDDLDELFPPANAMQERLVPIRQRLLGS
jgi:hypothetical protein